VGAAAMGGGGEEGANLGSLVGANAACSSGPIAFGGNGLGRPRCGRQKPASFYMGFCILKESGPLHISVGGERNQREHF
jgi:hypothetical protein